MTAPLPALLLFARTPVHGRVKTRLVPPLTQEGALLLYRAFLEDAARAYLAPGAWSAVLAADPDADHPDFVRLFAPPWRRQAQASGDLGERLAAAFEGEFSAGAPAAVAVGSDHPALARRRLEEVFGSLNHGGDAALVPAEDGGYCAIGLSARAPLAEIFREIPWSTASTLAVTRERMIGVGLEVSMLEAAYDVDRPEDLGRLRRDIASRDPNGADYPRATARVLAEIAP
jgi:rSAM/selenodomain-associated transferase 1